MITEDSLVQYEKAPSSIEVSDEGVEKVKVVKPVQLLKAELPIEVTDAGIFTEANFEQ